MIIGKKMKERDPLIDGFLFHLDFWGFCSIQYTLNARKMCDTQDTKYTILHRSKLKRCIYFTYVG